MNDHEKVLREAENQICLAPFTHKDKEKLKRSQTKTQELRKYLDQRVLDGEQRRIFEYDKKESYCDGDYD
jgi:regulatory protein YycI of two-component signal transduction system YycFG